MSDSVNVSIIIPNYNHYVFLEQRIRSVLNQTYQNFELILLDDASTDDSQNILQQYSNHPKVSHTFCNNENSESVFKQWIKGIELAKGAYIWIAESDDYAHPRFLESTLGLIEKNERIGMVFTDSIKVDEEDKELGLVSNSKKILQNLKNSDSSINSTNFADYLLNKLVVVNASSVLFRKEAILKVNFETLKKFKNTGDVFVYIGIALNYELFFLPQPLNYMRLHKHNTTKKNKKNGQLYKDKLMILDYYLKDFANIKTNHSSILKFLTGLIFFSIDHKHSKLLKQCIKKMVTYGMLDRKNHITIRTIIFFYSNLTFKGRPHAIRVQLKNLLEKSL